MELKNRLQRAHAKLGPSRVLNMWKYQVKMEFLTADDRKLVTDSIAAWKQDPTTPYTVELDRVRRLFELGYDLFLLRIFADMDQSDRLHLARSLRQDLKTLREKGIDPFPYLDL